jgi:HEAT repeat protein
MFSWQRIAGGLLLAIAAASGQELDLRAGLSEANPRARVRAVRAIGDSPSGADHLDLLAPLLRDESEEVRTAVVAALVKMRTIGAQPMLIEAAADLSSRVQSMAVDGLVDFHVPEYAQQGRMTSVSTYAAALRTRFSKPSAQVVPAYINVSREAIKAIGEVLRTGRSDAARANAARAIGILLGRGELDSLIEGTRSRNSEVILECVLAINKLQETSAGPEIVFLLHDLDPVLQEAAVQTVGQLRTSEAVPDLVRVLDETNNARIRSQALLALAKIPRNGQREMFISYLRHRDDELRAAAAEGIGRFGTSADLELLGQLMAKEKSLRARLSMAFAAVMLGNQVELARLVEGLNSRVSRARPLIVELARNPSVLRQLYIPLATGTPPQRRHLAVVLAHSGNQESVPYLESLTNDSNGEVASEALEALRILRARL